MHGKEGSYGTVCCGADADAKYSYLAGGMTAALMRSQCRAQHEERNIIEQDTICRRPPSRVINLGWRAGGRVELIKRGLVPVPAANPLQPCPQRLHARR